MVAIDGVFRSLSALARERWRGEIPTWPGLRWSVHTQPSC
jgi:hypothetical protein